MSVIQVTGDITVKQAQVGEQWVNQLPATGEVTIDLATIGESDSSCVAMLVLLKRRAQVNGLQISFINLPTKLLLLINLYEVGDLLALQP